jgi:hypothetical protein
MVAQICREFRRDSQAKNAAILVVLRGFLLKKRGKRRGKDAWQEFLEIPTMNLEHSGCCLEYEWSENGER